MQFHHLSPAEQVAETMSRIYRFGMTTTSGGNISIRDTDGSIWITPAAVDKGGLRPEDIVHVRPDGETTGLHRPSSELPFHRAVYRARGDLSAIIHAHPPALVSFSIARTIPDTRAISQARSVCGPVGYAEYELPGSEGLGARIAAIAADGFDAVIMENHGTLVGGAGLGDAFQRFETLEFCAKTIMEAGALGSVAALPDEVIEAFDSRDNRLPELSEHEPTSRENELRGALIDVVRRAYRQRLIISTYGTFSARVSDSSFLITPYGADRFSLDRGDLVYVENGRREPGALPSRAVRLFAEIYQRHPEIGCVITAQSPEAMAYAVTGTPLDTRTIPESYILLRDIPLLECHDQFARPGRVADVIGSDTPIALLKNDSLLVTGGTVFETFDRLEVCEFSARSLVRSRSIGPVVPMGEAELEDIRRTFLER